MKINKDLAAQFEGLYLVHQNVPGKKALSQQHSQHIIFIPLQGEITIQIEGQKITLGLGQMLYLPPNTKHSFYSSEKLGERLIVMIDTKLLLLADTLRVIKLPLNQFIKELLFYLLLHPKSKNAKSLVSVFTETLQESFENASAPSHLDHLFGKISDTRVKNALVFMQENISESVDMATIAKKAGLSGRNFNRLILKETGLPPKQWLIQFRIDKAKELLKGPNASVTDVAFSVGYNSLGQFISAFRARTGQLPSEFLRHG